MDGALATGATEALPGGAAGTGGVGDPSIIDPCGTKAKVSPTMS
tara:strand:- start:2458 stop:2589 length:132 start_codon:yes stop_codon:yes gene_type:complete